MSIFISFHRNPRPCRDSNLEIIQLCKRLPAGPHNMLQHSNCVGKSTRGGLRLKPLALLSLFQCFQTVTLRMGIVSKLCLLTNDINAFFPHGLRGLSLFPGQWSRDYREVRGGLRQRTNEFSCVILRKMQLDFHLPRNLN